MDETKYNAQSLKTKPAQNSTFTMCFDTLESRTDLTCSEKRVLGRLYRIAGYSDKWIRVGENNLCTMLGMNYRTLRRTLVSLQNSGWLECKRTGRSNMYQVKMPATSTPAIGQSVRSETDVPEGVTVTESLIGQSVRSDRTKVEGLIGQSVRSTKESLLKKEHVREDHLTEDQLNTIDHLTDSLTCHPSGHENISSVEATGGCISENDKSPPVNPQDVPPPAHSDSFVGTHESSSASNEGISGTGGACTTESAPPVTTEGFDDFSSPEGSDDIKTEDQLIADLRTQFPSMSWMLVKINKVTRGKSLEETISDILNLTKGHPGTDPWVRQQWSRW